MCECTPPPPSNRFPQNAWTAVSFDCSQYLSASLNICLYLFQRFYQGSANLSVLLIVEGKVTQLYPWHTAVINTPVKNLTSFITSTCWVMYFFSFTHCTAQFQIWQTFNKTGTHTLLSSNSTKSVHCQSDVCMGMRCVCSVCVCVCVCACVRAWLKGKCKEQPVPVPHYQKGNQTEDACGPEHAESVQTSSAASFIWLFCQQHQWL